jgi:pimeloyl-ACP methyl ester carboxylesterase
MEERHRTIETNGITMHITEQGEGPLVVLCHGFPELGYCWRHQLPALAEAGFHAVAPDQRGYGRTDRPEPLEAYDIFHLVGDIVGLVHALGEEEAIIVGHDWGSTVAQHCALLRPDIFRTVILLSVPFASRSWKSRRPTEGMKKLLGDQDLEFYILYFQEQGRVEEEIEEDVRAFILGSLYAASGDPPPEKRWQFVFPKGLRFIDTSCIPDTLPAWLTERDIDFYTGEFRRTGFRGGVNWYRNIDRNWEMTPFLSGAKIHQPTLFIAGDLDGVITFSRGVFDRMDASVPNLKQKILIPGAGHWIQQERPGEVNDLIIRFLKDLE